MVLRRLLLALAFAAVAVSAFAQAPPALTSASLTSTTCPGSGCVDLNVSGYASAAVQLTGTWSATVTFRGSVDGSNFQAINCTPTNSTSATTSATANGVWFCSVTGLRFARAVVTSYTSGTVVASLQASASGGGSGGGGGGGSTPTNTIGAAISTTVVPMGGKDGSGNAQTATFDASGNMLVAVTGAGSGGTSSADGAVYTAGTTAGTPGMLARDDTAPSSLAEDRVGIPRGSANRNAYIQIRDGAGNERGANVTAAGGLQVDGSGVTQPVSAASLPLPTGAATSAAQTTGNTSLSSIDGKVPALVSGRVPVDGSGVTQPVSAAALPLPSGAATAAKQPALGTAGLPSADVLTVQGVASMTALKVDGSAVTQPVSGTFWQATQPVSGTVTANVGNFPTTASTSAVSVRCVDTTGSSFESCGGAGGGGGTSSTFGAAVPATGTAAGFSDGTNMQAARVFDGDTGAGTQYVAGVVLRASGSGGSVETGTASNPLRVDPTGTTTQPVSLTTGANLVGYVGSQATYGTKTTLTTTNYTSLVSNTAANCTTGCWQSASITTSGAKDLLLRIQTKGQAGSTAYADIYVCASMSSDSTFSGGCSGTEGAYTVANVPNGLRYLGSILYLGTTATTAFFELSDSFVTLPGKVAFVIKNQSGGTVSTTAGDHVFDYQLVN